LILTDKSILVLVIYLFWFDKNINKFVSASPISDMLKSYLTITFNSEGVKPSEVVDRLHMLGFKPTYGPYDFMYDWGKHATVKDAIWFSDKIQEALKGCKVLFHLETVGIEEENE
jgi:hypothetical protein